MKYRLLVCGSRYWINREAILKKLRTYPKNTVLIHGACKGADSLAASIGRELGFDTISFPADWARYRKGAGPIRNQQMLDEGKPTHVIAFHENLANSAGTKDMINKAMNVGLTVDLITS